jgi:hypothetical protein
VDETQRTERLLFQDTQLALCVVSSLVGERLLRTQLTIPEPEPDDLSDLADESESWRDGETNQDRAIEALRALLESRSELLEKVSSIDCELAMINNDWEYTVDLNSLQGIEACTNLEHIAIRSTYETLDLAPLAALSALTTVDLRDAPSVRNLRPLLEIKSLRKVLGVINDAVVASALRSRAVVIE